MRYLKSFNLYLAAPIIAVFASAWGGMEMPALLGATVHANGFTVPLVQGDSGPYTYRVGIWPAKPMVGNLHMAIALTSEHGPVTGATVDVRGRIGQKGPLSEPVAAPGYFLQPWSYELDLNLREPGRWTFEIKIDSLLGATVIEVPMEVAAESGRESSGGPEGDNKAPGGAGPNWALITGALAVLVLGFGGWMFIQRQRAESTTAGSSQTRRDGRKRRR